MENFFQPLSTNSTNSNTNASRPNMACSQDSQFSSIYGPLGYPFVSPSSSTQYSCYPPQSCNMPPPQAPPPFESQQFPCTYSLGQSSVPHPLHPFCFGQNQTEMQSRFLLQPNWLPLVDQERRALDAYKTRVARSNRKLARQRSLSRPSSGAGSSHQVDTRRLALNGGGAGSTDVQISNNSNRTINRDLYVFLTPENRRLRVLLRKELKKSDVGSLGRIVLPKKEAEENLPTLCDKEGIPVVMRDVFSNQDWSMKFKYWSNNKSRMYVLENTGDFVKQNGLECGDSLTLYEDESKNLYFTIKRAERAAITEPVHSQNSSNQNNNYLYLTLTQTREEEDASLQLLIEQFTNKEHQEEANSLVTLPMDDASSYIYKGEASSDPFDNVVTSSTRTNLQLTTLNNVANINTFHQTAAFDNVTNVSTLPQPVVSAKQPSSSQQGKMRVADDHHTDDCYTGLGMLPDAYWYNF